MALPSWMNGPGSFDPTALEQTHTMYDPLDPRRKIALLGTTENDLRTVAAQLSMLLDAVPEELLPAVMFFAGFSAPSVERVGNLLDRARLQRRYDPARLVGLLRDKVARYINHKLDDEDFMHELHKRR